MATLDGKVALVTGAARRRGIGRGIALELARAGADVVVHGLPRAPSDQPAAEQAIDWQGARSVADEVTALGRRALAVEGDLTDRETVRRIALEVEERLGTVDVLVNNAAVPGGAGDAAIIDLDDELWYRTVDVNLNAVYLVTKAFAGGMVRAGAGSIINISSVAGRAGQPRMGAYCATKFAVVGLTQQLALELAPAVRVNCICPGSTDTDMMDGTFVRRDQAAGSAPGTAKAARVRSLPLARQGRPEDLGNAVVFLASDAASWITGQTLNVDGGQRMD
ncbi:MAG: meso-butanediol dehydrogenase / (S,S)-butanediol dehydrogenase / diacetyl reductase [Baekduia sp.]|jgi:3-oxoacyl-[acyl-carrier protein] reductase/meso-butanediol dehydrogenase/(S,S)-butanediol dehydrogenase/diacetyl reductase|nr:meso-butanediol dehydrogenase / (S,S)-butanediol dehydrogenase / diacetyl reductase [Baekduia sp.]